MSTELSQSTQPESQETDLTSSIINEELDIAKFARKSTSSGMLQTPKDLQDRYEFVREIGRGNQGTVYLAKQKATGQEVAIKELRIDSVQNWKEYELFHREADALKALDLPGVAHFYEAPEYLNADPPCAYIVQEFIPGKSIEEMIKGGYRFSITQIFKISLQLLDILQELHTHNPPVIHRDLKPGNIIIKPLGKGQMEPYIIDFGAVANPQVQGGGSTIAGTYGYMPPEQLMGTPTPASDLYALAATIAALLSGISPAEMQTQDYRLIIEPHLENIPNIVISTLRQMLEPDMKKRLTDYTELRTRFTAFYKNDFIAQSSIGANKKDASQFNESLMAVKELGQRGNLDLWIDLPEQLPRDIPQIYQNIRPRPSASTKMPRLYRSISAYKTTHSILFYITLAAMMLSVIVVLIYSAITPNSSALVFIFPMAMIVLTIAMSVRDSRHIIAPSDFYIKAHEQPDINNFKSMYDAILEKGTKTVATIVDISYVHAGLEMLESYHIKSAVEFKNDNLVGYYHSSPKFRIRYKFNPPDDDNPADLIHEVYTHKDYTGKLKVGDPLPILYLISPQNNLHVFSTPFPFPLNDIYDIRDIYYSPLNLRGN